MKQLLLVFCIGLFFSADILDAEDALRTAADRPVDILNMTLDLNVFLKEKRVRGIETLDFVPLRAVQTLRLNAIDHEIQSVSEVLAGTKTVQPLAYENTGTELLVNFSHTISRDRTRRIEIRYQVRDPKSGLHFFQPSFAEPNVPLMVWSQGEPIANRYWFPCLDHPNERQTTDMIVTVDEGFEALSNGRLVERKELKDVNKVRFHWKQSQPHAAYLVTLVVGKFAVKREEWHGRPVLYYVPPDRANDIQRSFGRTTEMLDFFSERFGIEYPWPKYAQVVVEQFSAGGMENTSATTLHRRALYDKRAILDGDPDRLIAHELAHQWWGDLVTCKDWTHLWLNEGFATYSEVLWTEYKLGPDERDYLLYQKSRSARSGSKATKRPIVDRRYPTARSMFDSRAYPKGGWVLHMLRKRVGDADFFRALKHYGTTFAYQTTETSDFRQTFERLLGRSLERFFYDWTERPGHPELTVKTSYQPEDRLAKLTMTQTQSGEAFQFPLKVEWVCSGTPAPVTVEPFVTEKELTVYVPVPARPKLVRIDPDYTLLANLKEEKSRDWWKEQLLAAPTVVERIRAVEHFADRKNDADRKLLKQVLSADLFYGVRVEAAAALGKSGGDLSRDTLIAGLEQEHPKVRRACATALGKFVDDQEVADLLLKRLDQGDASYSVEAAVVTSIGKVQRSPAPQPFIRALKLSSRDEVIRRAALKGLGQSDGSQVLETLLEWTRRGKPRDCRTAAIRSLATYLKRSDVSQSRKTQVVEQIAGYLAGEVPRIRRAAVETLRDLGSTARPVVATVESLAEHDPDSRVRETATAAVEKMKAEEVPAQDLARLHKEIEAVRKQNRKLEDRLQKIESK